MDKLWLIGSYPPPYGGVAIFVKNLHRCLAEQHVNHKMLISSSKSYEGMINLRDEIIQYGCQLIKIDAESCIIDSCNMFLEYPEINKARVWNIILKIKNWKWIKIFHDGTLPVRYKSFSYREKMMIINSVRKMYKIIVVSNELKNWLLEEIGYKGDIIVIDSILPQKIENKKLDGEIDKFIESYDYIVTSIGTCNKEYGFQDIVKAVERSQYRDRIGIILIDGSFAEKSQEYLKRADEYRKMRNVSYIGQGLDNETTISLLAQSTVFIRGVFHESYGISRVEAILAGTPVIATNVGETRGMLLYDPGDVGALKENLDHILGGKCSIEINKWKEFYEDKAKKNFELIKEIIDGAMRE